MAIRQHDAPKHDALPGEPDIARVYRAGGGDEPPPLVDSRILDEARTTVQLLHPPRKRWAVSLSTAAVVVLAVSVLLLMSKEGTLDRNGALAPNEYSLPPAEEATRDSLPPTGRAVEPDRMPQQREDKSYSRLATPGVAAMKTSGADVTAVQVLGSTGAYTFNVTVKSPDTGCQQYADWWEVVSEDGKLLYRRVLLHSHVDEQPFTRSGGPVPVQADTIVWVRAHMNTSGYGGVALKGSVKSGFKPAVPATGFAANLAKLPPLPEGCDF